MFICRFLSDVMLVEKIVVIKVKRLVKKRIIIKVDDDLEFGVLV